MGMTRVYATMKETVELVFYKGGKGKFTRLESGSLLTVLSLEEARDLLKQLQRALYGPDAFSAKPCTLTPSAQGSSHAIVGPILATTRLDY